MLGALKDALSVNEDQITAVAGLLAERGWAEGNGGNFSIRTEKSYTFSSEPVNLPGVFPQLNSQSFLVKTRGSRMRDVARNPLANVSLVSIDEQGSSYRHQSEKGLPTTELASHMAAHSVFVESRPLLNAFLHTHPTSVIALSHILKEGRELTHILPRMFPEAALLLKDNIEQLPYITPGGIELGNATRDALRKVNALIWSGHGMAAAGPDLFAALDLVEVAEKAARIALLLGDKLAEAGLSDGQLKSLYDAFGV